MSRKNKMGEEGMLEIQRKEVRVRAGLKKTRLCVKIRNRLFPV